MNSSGSDVWSLGERGASPWYRGGLSADLLADRFSRDSSRVPKSAVFRNEPRRRRVRRCCCITADIALPLTGAASLGACSLLDPKSSLSPSCSMASDCVAWLRRRKESLESKEPERFRLWPLLALPDRVRLDGLSTANSALLLRPSSIGAGGKQELGHQLDMQFPSMGIPVQKRIRCTRVCFCSPCGDGVLLWGINRRWRRRLTVQAPRVNGTPDEEKSK